ncbi:MAG: benzoate/H(+) symporter BenE family transporter, partial [Burkholderiaceae bacterium]
MPAIVAGFVTVLVGFTSSAVIVFEAARALGASEAQIASWMWALGLGMGLTCIVPSLRWRMPVVTAWSTPGAAMLITGAAGVPLAEATGAFIVSALLIAVSGFSGWFERAMNRIPIALAAAMLAGVLLRFGMEAFASMQTRFGLVFAMFAAWLIARRLWPRYAVVVSLAAGV